MQRRTWYIQILLHVPSRDYHSPNEREKKRVFVCTAEWCSVLCLFAGTHRESLKVHQFVASIGFPPPLILPGTHIWVWINRANWGFDRTNSHWLMSHTGHWMRLMLQLKRPPRCEVCKHLVLLCRSQLSGEVYSISTIKVYISDLNCKLWLNVISSFHFFSFLSSVVWRSFHCIYNIIKHNF